MPNSRIRELLEKYRSRRRLSRNDLRDSIKFISTDRMTNAQIVLFLEKISHMRTTDEERALLAMEMVKYGQQLRSFWKGSGLLYDKHGIGGIPGDSSSLITVPLCAHAGLKCPKVSTAAITSAAGHADIMCVISEVDLYPSRAAEVLEECNGFLLWSGGKLGIVPADSKIVNVQHDSFFDFVNILVPSILAKKKAMGSDIVVMDISWGSHCKIPNEKEAKKVANSFKRVGHMLGINVIPLLFHEKEPAGRFVGPALQAREVLMALENKDFILSFVQKALKMAACLLAISSSNTFDESYEHAKRLFLEGYVSKKLRQIANAQGAKLQEFDPQEIWIPKCTKDVLSDTSGIVADINLKDLNQWASLLVGNGRYRKTNAGLECHVKLGQEVKEGDSLVTFYANNKRSLRMLPEDERIVKCFRIAK